MPFASALCADDYRQCKISEQLYDDIPATNYDSAMVSKNSTVDGR
jgi:hypothetical protein